MRTRQNLNRMGSGVKQFTHGLRYLKKNDWAWLHFTLSIGVLCPVITLLNPPQAVRTGLVAGTVMNLVIGMLLLGGLVSAIGLLIRTTKVRPLIVGYAIEMAGLIPLMAGPGLLAVVYLVSAFTARGPGSLVGFAFCYSLVAALFARYVDTLLHHLASKKDTEKRGQRR